MTADVVLLRPAQVRRERGDPVAGSEGVSAGLTTSPGNTTLTLTWSPVASGVGYNVKVHTLSGGPYVTRAAATTATSFVDTGLTNGQAYFYVVSAQNATDESANSTEVSANAGVRGHRVVALRRVGADRDSSLQGTGREHSA